MSSVSARGRSVHMQRQPNLSTTVMTLGITALLTYWYHDDNTGDKAVRFPRLCSNAAKKVTVRCACPSCKGEVEGQGEAKGKEGEVG